jgi:glycosyltransferase involved in cell wall biosynthesis
MRILLATYWCLPHVGGVDTYVRTLKKELEEHGHHVDVLAHHPDMDKIYLVNYGRHDELDGAFTDKIIEISKIKNVVSNQVNHYYQTYLPHVNFWIRSAEIERYTFELATSLFNLNDYDVIHTQDIVSTRSLWRVKPNPIPLVSTLHGLQTTVHILSGDITNEDSILWKYAVTEEYYGAMSSDQAIVPTTWLQQELSKMGVPNDKFSVIPYGMDLFSFRVRLKDEPDPPVQNNSKQFIIACPARLVPIKNHKTLIEALSIVKETRNDFICWLIGDGTLRNDLERFCEEKELANDVVFMGNRTDVPALLNKADIMVLPSLEDNHPYVIMEAQVAGKTIVASNSGGIPEMVKHKETGLIFENQNSLQLASMLVEVMSYPQLRHHLETNAKEWGEIQWSSKLLYERTMNIYNEVLATTKSPRDI